MISVLLVLELNKCVKIVMAQMSFLLLTSWRLLKIVVSSMYYTEFDKIFTSGAPRRHRYNPRKFCTSIEILIEPFLRNCSFPRDFFSLYKQVNNFIWNLFKKLHRVKTDLGPTVLNRCFMQLVTSKSI